MNIQIGSAYLDTGALGFVKTTPKRKTTMAFSMIQTWTPFSSKIEWGPESYSYSCSTGRSPSWDAQTTRYWFNGTWQRCPFWHTSASAFVLVVSSVFSTASLCNNICFSRFCRPLEGGFIIPNKCQCALSCVSASVSKVSLVSCMVVFGE